MAFYSRYCANSDTFSEDVPLDAHTFLPFYYHSYLDAASLVSMNFNRQLRSSIVEVVDRVQQLSEWGLVHHLPVSA